MLDPNENRPIDFRLIAAFVLMFAVVIIFSNYFMPAPPKPQQKPATEAGSPVDTAVEPWETPDEEQPEVTSLGIEEPDLAIAIDTILVETPLYTARFSTRGADLIDYRLKKYFYITEETRDEEISLLPASAESALRFEFWGRPLKLWQRGFTVNRDRVSLTNNGDSSVVVFTSVFQGEYEVQKKYIFYGDRYSFDIELSIPADFPITLEREYTFGWDPGLGPTEYHKKEDIDNIAAVALLGKDLEEVDEIDDNDRPKRFGGTVRWAGVRTKYFLNVIVPRTVEPVEFIADRRFDRIKDQDDEYRVPYFSSRFAVPLSRGQALNHRYTVFMGPLDYFVIKDYELGFEKLLSLGWKFIIRPFAIVVLWSFQKLYSFIPNYGFVIILFGFLIKTVFHPLTKKSMVSMGRMKEMSPKLQKLRDKYKEDPQRLNRETMKMYKEAGFNPISGCLPLLAQMPVFFALYQVLRSSIQLRGAEFVMHITDLSQKDSLYILPIIMTISFFWQQKMTATDPKQKALVYIMPLVFGFLFAQSPAGLTLYWTIYNVFSVVEQYIIKASKKKNESAGTS